MRLSWLQRKTTLFKGGFLLYTNDSKVKGVVYEKENEFKF